MTLRIVHKIEPGMDRGQVLATDYQMRNPCIQFRDAFANHLDVMCYALLLRATQLIKPGWRVVDICCGRSLMLPFIRHFRKDVGEYVGVDLSERNLREAQRRACGKDIDHEVFYSFPHRWVLCNAAEVSRHLPHDYFDLGIFTSSIEHMSKAMGEQSLRECGKVLKDGGLLYLSSPRTPEDQDGFDTQYRSAHLYEWKLSELRAGLREAGFAIEREHGLLINKKDLIHAASQLGPQVRLLLEPLIECLPTEFATACLAAPFPALAKEVLILARKAAKR